MSRVIENDHPFDEFEIQYLQDRNRDDEVKANKEKFDGVTESETEEPKEVSLTDETIEFIKALDEDQVKSALESRGMSTDGSTKELKFALAQQIQSEKDAG